MKMKCRVCKIKFMDKTSFEDGVIDCKCLTCPHKAVAKLIEARREPKVEIQVDDPISEFIDT